MNKEHTSIIKEINKIHIKRRKLNIRENILYEKISQLKI